MHSEKKEEESWVVQGKVKNDKETNRVVRTQNTGSSSPERELGILRRVWWRDGVRKKPGISAGSTN